MDRIRESLPQRQVFLQSSQVSERIRQLTLPHLIPIIRTVSRKYLPQTEETLSIILTKNLLLGNIEKVS